MIDDTNLPITTEDIAITIAWHMDTQRRIYDVLLAILATTHSSKAKELQEMHERGEFLFPPPWQLIEETGP